MGKKNVTKSVSKNAPKVGPKVDQKAAQEFLARKKKFIKKMMEAQQLVVFTNSSEVHHFGFGSNGDFVLFLLQQVYNWDGKNDICAGIINNILNSQSRPVADEEQDETQKILDDLEEEEGLLESPGNEDDLSSDDSSQAVDGAETPSKDNAKPKGVIPMKKNDSKKVVKSSQEKKDELSVEVELLALREKVKLLEQQNSKVSA